MPKLPTGMCKFLFHLCYARMHTESQLLSATPGSTCQRSSQAAVTRNARSTHTLISDRHHQTWPAKGQPPPSLPLSEPRADTATLCREAISEMSLQMVCWPPPEPATAPTVSWLWETLRGAAG